VYPQKNSKKVSRPAANAGLSTHAAVPISIDVYFVLDAQLKLARVWPETAKSSRWERLLWHAKNVMM